ncbi:hypothetical protein N7516_008538 [Penicillium verrucosum]|uniref:uncharacterized protein n=1 Tax=Penicillium verrucosum TaxID=60171 RepID=UPI002545563A|nr:uncharacterized protein N7516_008538 [Penicillium verrucosum]KAJ5926765.1 hypothetical protein N7516_008538 [Penicillium verrucosum]
MVITPSTLTINLVLVLLGVLVFWVFLGGRVDGHHSIHLAHQSGVGWMVITPSTLTINLILYWRCFGVSGVFGGR